MKTSEMQIIRSDILKFLSIAILKILRKAYWITFNKTPELRNWKMFSNKEYSNELIFNLLAADEPCMISRIGSTEMLCITNYLGVENEQKKSISNYVKGDGFPWWWEISTIDQMQRWSGFFPSDIKKLKQFSELMLEDIKAIDVLGSWLNDEKYLQTELRNAKRVVLEDLEPFFSKNPWTRVLEGKKVLVVHPFSEDIESQYKKRSLLFDNDLLPDFELKTIKAVQSIAGEETQFDDWFAALDSMKVQIDNTDYDVCIIGCGAYGLPLAAHVKRTGKKAVHLGGVTQLLFGIKGSRWEEYIVWPYMNLFNEHWVRPGESAKPNNANQVEGACYW
ncbi:MAG: hypothetical protein ACJA2G_001637 [Cognaticolwellia sp.]|jgi:hypothetical protein